jgi:hypothetical protein
MRYDISKSKAHAMPALGKGTECIKILLSQVSKDNYEPFVPMFSRQVRAFGFAFANSRRLHLRIPGHRTCRLMRLQSRKNKLYDKKLWLFEINFVSLHHESVCQMIMKKELLFFVCGMGLLLACIGCDGGQNQPRAYVSEVTGADSIAIRMGNYKLQKYHSNRLNLDINYPSFLVHQNLSENVGMQELFMMDDVSISVMVDSIQGMIRSSGQTMMGMGADLVDVGDDYSILQGTDDKWEYYGKVIDSDTLRQVTVMLRYYPEHEDAVELLKDWVRGFQVNNK